MKQPIDICSSEQRRCYAAYGSNMPGRQMLARCPGARLVGAGWLEGWKLRFNRHADIVEEAGARTPAVIWEISAEDERNLDIYEGYPRYYEKADVTVSTDSGTLSAMAYTMTAAYKTGQEAPDRYYMDIIREGYAEHGFAKEAEAAI